MNNNLDRIQIVLVEPQSSENIGSVCRAMKTMGIGNLAITGRRVYDRKRIANLAVHSYDIYEKSLRFDDLFSAVKTSALVAGTTRRLGKKRKYFSINPEELAAKIGETCRGTVSIVFGRESDGLTVEELSICNLAVQIPASPESPSLNLAQAVQVITYALYRTEATAKGSYNPVSLEKIKNTVEELTLSLEETDFFKKNEKEEFRQFFTDIFMRAGVSMSEYHRIQKTFRKIAGIMKKS